MMSTRAPGASATGRGCDGSAASASAAAAVNARDDPLMPPSVLPSLYSSAGGNDVRARKATWIAGLLAGLAPAAADEGAPARPDRIAVIDTGADTKLVADGLKAYARV